MPYNLVFPIKPCPPSSKSTDLRYSLRSVFANAKSFSGIVLAGAKPCWVKDVLYIPTEQVDTRWKNSLHNVAEACRCNDVTSTFVLMNDDFFAINSVDLATDLNLCRGSLEKTIAKYRREQTTPWHRSFAESRALLRKLGSEHFYDFTLHCPMLINKDNFLYMLSQDAVKEHLNTHAMFSYRTIYGNLFYSNPKEVPDFKIARQSDVPDWMLPRQWISVHDNITDNLELYPKLNCILSALPFSPVENV